MTTNRSTGFIAAALMAAGTTTALCYRDALARATADGDAIHQHLLTRRRARCKC